MIRKCSCGASPVLEQTKYGDWYMYCPACKKQFPMYYTRKDIIRVWNGIHKELKGKEHQEHEM